MKSAAKLLKGTLMLVGLISVAHAGERLTLSNGRPLRVNPQALVDEDQLSSCRQIADATRSEDQIKDLKMRCSRHEFAAAPAGAIKMSDDGKIFAFAYDRALYIQDKSTSVQKTFVIGGSSTRLHKIVSLAVDAANREIFVMTSEPTEILAFPIETEGNVAPLRVIDNPALSGSIALSLDPVHNELFVVRSQSSSIQVLKRLANNQGPRSIFSQDVQRTIQVETNPRGIAYLSKLDQVAVVLENGHIVLHNRVLEPSKNSSISVTEASNAFVVVSASSKIEWLNRDGSVGEKSF